MDLIFDKILIIVLCVRRQFFHCSCMQVSSNISYIHLLQIIITSVVDYVFPKYTVSSRNDSLYCSLLGETRTLLRTTTRKILFDTLLDNDIDVLTLSASIENKRVVGGESPRYKNRQCVSTTASISQ